jgi:hypothetical protein
MKIIIKDKIMYPFTTKKLISYDHRHGFVPHKLCSTNLL